MLACMAGVGLAKCDGKCSQPPRPLGALVQASEKKQQVGSAPFLVARHLRRRSVDDHLRATEERQPQLRRVGLRRVSPARALRLRRHESEPELLRPPHADGKLFEGVHHREESFHAAALLLPRHTSFGTLRVVMLGVARSRRRFLPACRRRTTSAVLTDDGLYMRQAATDL